MAYLAILGTHSKDLIIGTRLLVFNILFLIHLPIQCCQMASLFFFFKARFGKNISLFYLYVLKLFLFNVKLIYWSCYDSLLISLTSFLLITSVVKETLTS